MRVIMEIDHKQKMQSRQAQCVSICSQLNLNPDKLRVQSLLASGTYRRLYNIVINDMSRSDLSFRKNLIKELYFLLQITPIIKPELKEHFLGEVQRWYNLNDHKKIDLASSKLNDLLSIVHHSRKDSTREGNERPKTGGTWNTNVNPFLRPYTASRVRPDSGKGSKIGQTTQADTNDICIREFTTNIQEELQMSQDFLQKHRTNHPQYEPSYEQLYHILKKVETQPQEQPPKIQQSYTSSLAKCGRYSKSAIPRRQEVVIVKENPQSNPHIQGEQQCIENQERERDSDSSSEEQEVLYVSDKRQEPTHTLRIEVPSPNAEGKPDELQKYLHCIEQKLVQAMREDRQMASNYVGFARAKTAFKRELNRKNESRRLLSAKQNAREYRLKRPVSALSGKQNKQNFKGIIHDLTNDPLNIPAVAPNKYPKYNRRDFLRAKYEQPVVRFKKLNKVQQPGEKVKGKVKRPMTACVRFHSPLRFDPLSPDNVTAYNAQVLQEIEKIKMRMGGKCSASTDSLMKALYVDSSSVDAKWQDMNPFYGMVSKGRQKLKKKGRRPKSKAKLTSKS